MRLHVQCTNRNSANFTDHQQHIIPLSIPASVKSLKFSELMQMYMDWTQSTDQFCDTCQHSVKVRNEKQLLILQVVVWNSIGGNVIKRKINIASTLLACCPAQDQVAITQPYCQFQEESGYISMSCLLWLPLGLEEKKMC